MSSATALLFDKRMLLHHHPEDEPFEDYCPDTDHPETPLRCVSIWQALRSAGLVKRCTRLAAREATRQELQLVHRAFMAHVGEHRKERLACSLEDVCTGETWLAINAEPLGLVVRSGLNKMNKITPKL